MPNDNGTYSFASWFRRGLATQIQDIDDLGQDPNAGSVERAGLEVTVMLGHVPRGGGPEVESEGARKTVQMTGPGDILGFKREAVIRTEPPAGSLRFEAGGLPFVEFYEEDFPWRYTPARAANDGNLRPWVALFVLEEAEFAYTPGDGVLPPYITLLAEADEVLPPHDESWAWAHVQVARPVAAAGDLPGAIAADPDHALSRLVCPRRLDPDKTYRAFVVPAFETGRRAGLGLPVGVVKSQRASWGVAHAADARPDEFPVYFEWSFKTSTTGDFESLVRLLKPAPAGPKFGKRTMDIRDPGYGIDTKVGLAAWWRFAEGAGFRASDSSGAGNHGTLSGGVGFSNDPEFGSVLDFVQADGAVTIPHQPNLEPVTGTISAWVKVANLHNADVVMKTTARWVRREIDGEFSVIGIRITDDGRAVVLVGNDDPEAGDPWTMAASRANLIQPARWHHLALRWDGRTAAVFVDGALQAEQAYRPVPGTGLSYHQGSAVGLGVRTEWGPGSQNYHLTGQLAEVRYYGRACSDAEIRANFAARGGRDGPDAALAGNGTVDIEGALQPPGFSRQPFPDSPGEGFAGALEQLLDLPHNLEQGQAEGARNPFQDPNSARGYAENLPEDPIVIPPIYAGSHAGVTCLAEVPDALRWVRELNLDPRNRVAAALGTEVVVRRQEELMERAWKQVGQVNEANQRLREAELALALSESLFRKHLAGAGADRVLTLTSAAQRALRGTTDGSIRTEVNASRVPVAAQAPAFRRVSRPQRKTMRTLTGSGSISGIQGALFARLNQERETALSVAPPAPDPRVSVRFETVSDAVGESVAQLESEGATVAQGFLELLRTRLAGMLPIGAVDEAAFRAGLRAVIPQFQPDPPAADRPQFENGLRELTDSIVEVTADGPEAALVTIRQAAFERTYGTGVRGKSYAGVTVVSDAAQLASGEVARATGVEEAREYRADLSSFNRDVLAGRPLPEPQPALAQPPVIAGLVLNALQPRLALVQRVSHSLGGIAQRSGAEMRPLRPVMAHPRFSDAEFEDLRRISQDYIIPNFGDLPQNSLTLLEGNPRFLEAFMAGLNSEMARELLWREYPTDLRGTYFRRFWDTRDAAEARDDIVPVDEWRNALGEHSARAGGFLVLVIRGELLEKYPYTVVYAQKAEWDGNPSRPRRLSETRDENLLFPAFQGRLEPDISIYGFALDRDAARGHVPEGGADPEPAAPGWFFVLRERPGEVRLGMDDSEGGVAPLNSWADLSWSRIQFPNGTRCIRIADNQLQLTGNGAAGTPTAGVWGGSSADMAYILLQDPILYARHAAEMLP